MHTMVLLGHQLVLACYKIAVHGQIEKSMDWDTLHFTATEFENVRLNSRELLVCGLYFDIMSKEVKGDKITVRGVYDHHEKTLKSRITGKLEQKAAHRMSGLQKNLYLPLGETGIAMKIEPCFVKAKTVFYSSGFLPEGGICTIFRPPIS